MHLIKKITLIVVFSFLFANATSSQNLVIDSLEILLKSHTRTDTAKVNLLNSLAYEIRTQDPLQAKAYARQAGELAGQLDYPEGEARSLWIIGVATIYNDKEGALDNFRKALEIADETGDKIGQCNYLIAIGNAEKLQGEPTASNETYRQALRIAQEIGDKKLIIKARISISGNFVRSGNHLEANTLLRESIELEIGRAHV